MHVDINERECVCVSKLGASRSGGSTVKIGCHEHCEEVWC